jgi:hypothetical protein
MAFIKIGDRGAQVIQLQQNLNTRPSKLPRLIIDGVFGSKTQMRVLEFQRDNGLKADGIVGDLTNGKFRGNGGVQPAGDLAAIMNQLALQLKPNERSAFFNLAQPLVADRTLLASVTLIEAAVVIMILALIASLLIASASPSSQEMGRELDRKVRRLRERLRDEPAQSAAISAASLEAARETGRALAKRAQDEQKRCFDKFTPQELAQKMRNCAKFVTAVTTFLQALIIKTNTGSAGQSQEDALIKGIMASAVALIAALRDLGTCMGCDNLFF